MIRSYLLHKYSEYITTPTYGILCRMAKEARIPKGFLRDTATREKTVVTSPKNERPLSESQAFQVVLQEAKRLGIKPSLSEQKRWRGFTNAPSGVTTPLTEVSAQRVVALIDRTFELMSSSENPYFRESIELLNMLADKGHLVMRYVPNILVAGEHATMGVTLIEDPDKLSWELRISLDRVLNNANALSLALTLVHETDHLRRDFAYLSNYAPSATVIHRNENYDNNDFRRRSEAFAEAASARSLIYEFGLGVTRTVQLTSLQTAAAFIKLGSNSEDGRWIDYVGKNRASYL